MKKLMYVKNMTAEQAEAKSRIIELESVIRHTTNIQELKMAVWEARHLWTDNFSTEELMNPDPTWEPLHETLYRARMKSLGIVENNPTTVKVVVKDNATAVFSFKNNTFRWV